MTTSRERKRFVEELRALDSAAVCNVVKGKLIQYLAVRGQGGKSMARANFVQELHEWEGLNEWLPQSVTTESSDGEVRYWITVRNIDTWLSGDRTATGRKFTKPLPDKVLAIAEFLHIFSNLSINTFSYFRRIIELGADFIAMMPRETRELKISDIEAANFGVVVAGESEAYCFQLELSELPIPHLFFAKQTKYKITKGINEKHREFRNRIGDIISSIDSIPENLRSITKGYGYCILHPSFPSITIFPDNTPYIGHNYYIIREFDASNMKNQVIKCSYYNENSKQDHENRINRSVFYRNFLRIDQVVDNISFVFDEIKGTKFVDRSERTMDTEADVDKKLIEAVIMVNLEATQAALVAGADVNCVDETTGFGPIHIAASSGAPEIIDLLISEPRLDLLRRTPDGKLSSELCNVDIPQFEALVCAEIAQARQRELDETLLYENGEYPSPDMS
ncbi:MAG: hypothetical protein ACMVY4_07120 [Minwuia sp.]|uniref:hypothetical protein n=1 Tax=Minwuia sp. TaxID=2493630 RepID=UPI003A83E297